MLTFEYTRDQKVVQKFFPTWNEEKVKALAKNREVLQEIEAIAHLLDWSDDNFQVLTKDEEDLVRIESAVYILEGAAGERSVLTNHSYPIWKDPFDGRPQHERR